MGLMETEVLLLCPHSHRNTAAFRLECPSSFSSADSLCRKLEDLQQFQKREPENEEEVDVLSLSEPVKTNIKKEQEEKQEEVKFFLPPTPGSEFIGDVTQKIGITLQPVALHGNVYASVVEDMILKATEQLVNDILRQALAAGYQTASHNRYYYLCSLWYEAYTSFLTVESPMQVFYMTSIQ
ncbi:YEATS domain-containing protein 2 [Saguinus oedipus]|uniref:YEATS domain-containing protein 2 n=1 Tax=Saguinus oedipus TaxID=9490 RepID=A0ABQ9U291_SAGOE|nr:YEATS domain-containing protein 2 [Saguinus oedipus]